MSKRFFTLVLLFAVAGTDRFVFADELIPKSEIYHLTCEVDPIDHGNPTLKVRVAMYLTSDNNFKLVGPITVTNTDEKILAQFGPEGFFVCSDHNSTMAVGSTPDCSRPHASDNFYLAIDNGNLTHDLTGELGMKVFGDNSHDIFAGNYLNPKCWF